MSSHADRPEFQAALVDGEGRAVRESPTLGEERIYLARTHGGSRREVLILSLPSHVLGNTLRPIIIAVGAGLLVSFLLASIVVLRLSSWLAPSGRTADLIGRREQVTPWRAPSLSSRLPAPRLGAVTGTKSARIR